MPHRRLVALSCLAWACHPAPSPTPSVTTASDRVADPVPPPSERTATLGVGDRVPDLTLPAQDGTTFTLAEALATGPVVLVFYRGDW